MLLFLFVLVASQKEVPVGAQEAGEVQRGVVINNVHPGDPVQEVMIAGFETLDAALGFVSAGFVPDGHPLMLQTKLPPGQSVSFIGSSYLVFYYVWEDKPELYSVTRVHADQHLAIGSCGFQFLLGRVVPQSADFPLDLPPRPLR